MFFIKKIILRKNWIMVLKNFTLGRPKKIENISQDKKEIPVLPVNNQGDDRVSQEKVLEVEPSEPWEEIELKLVKNIDSNLANKLKGKILLQVEEHGEAWYIEPAAAKKYYMKDGETAHGMLRKFGLGIKNSDLNKIPVGIETRFEDIDSDNDGLADKLEEALKTDVNDSDTDNDGFLDGNEVSSGNNPLGKGKIQFNKSLSEKQKGKILLQVESRGEAWYINPTDGKRYYMKNGDAAYQIMRFLSLGITNKDLRKISVGKL